MKTDDDSSLGACDDSYRWKRTISAGGKNEEKDVEEEQEVYWMFDAVHARQEGRQSQRGCGELNCPVPSLAVENQKSTKQRSVHGETGWVCAS
jgi:hypothetical protein